MVTKAEFYAETDKAFGSKSAVALIDTRTLIRECLALSLQEKLSLSILTYPDSATWSRDPAAASTCVIILSAEDLGSADLRREFLRELSGRNAAPVVILSENTSAQNVADAVRCGARGFIPTKASLDVTAEAIQLVLAGGCFIPATVMESDKRQEFASAPKTMALTEFTPGENRIVEPLLQGKSNKAIAYDTGLAESTVKYHIRSILRKLRTRNRTEAVTKLSQTLARAWLHPDKEA